MVLPSHSLPYPDLSVLLARVGMRFATQYRQMAVTPGEE